MEQDPICMYVRSRLQAVVVIVGDTIGGGARTHNAQPYVNKHKYSNIVTSNIYICVCIYICI